MQEIDLYDLLRFYAKKWLFILVCVAIGFGAGSFYNDYLQVPMYKSEATLLITANDSISSDQNVVSINNYLQLMTSRRVLEPVIDKLDLSESYDKLVNSVSVSNDKDTDVVKIIVVSDNPENSSRIVATTIDSFKQELVALYKSNTIQVIDGASISYEPYNVRASVQLILFAAAGFLFSIVCVFFAYDYKQSSKKIISGVKSTPDNKLVTSIPVHTKKQIVNKLKPSFIQKLSNIGKVLHAKIYPNKGSVNKTKSVKAQKRDAPTGRYTKSKSIIPKSRKN